MSYRSIIVELTPDKTVTLLTHVEEDWVIAQIFHDDMRKTVEARKGTVLYASLLNLEGLGEGRGCCGDNGPVLY